MEKQRGFFDIFGLFALVILVAGVSFIAANTNWRDINENSPFWPGDFDVDVPLKGDGIFFPEDEYIPPIDLPGGSNTGGTGQVAACTKDAFQCSDGTVVGRTGLSCEFVCPTIPVPPSAGNPTGSFEACAAAGFPIMESYPEQCFDGFQTYVRTIIEQPLPEEPVMCTADAMQCPDGSWVGRTGPNCEFVCSSVPELPEEPETIADWWQKDTNFTQVYGNPAWNTQTVNGFSLLSGYVVREETSGDYGEGCGVIEGNYVRYEGGMCRVGYRYTAQELDAIYIVDSKEKLADLAGPIDSVQKAQALISLTQSDLQQTNYALTASTAIASNGYLVRVTHKNTFGCNTHEPFEIIYLVTTSGQISAVATQPQREPDSNEPILCVD